MRKIVIFLLCLAIIQGNLLGQTASAVTSQVTVSPAAIPANGTTTLTVQLKDQFGANITNSSGITVTIPNPSSGTVGTVTNNLNGTYTATYTASATQGSVVITPKLSTTNFTNTATVTVGGFYAYVLNATSGNATSSQTYSTNGNLRLGLGFFVDYLIVGGGGAGSSGNAYAGGGGGGDVEIGTNLELTSTNFTVTVGTGNLVPGTAGASAASSSAFGITALGGKNSTTTSAGVSGNGRAGGINNYDGGGGGGAGAAGTNGTSNTSNPRFAGSGGIGFASDITGTSTYYGGGGAGGYLGGVNPGDGGQGGGGNPDVAGTPNTGGGGGGGANGGSGVVVVRYLGSSVGSIGGTISTGTGTATGYTLHRFNSSGNFNLASVDFNTRLKSTLSGVISGTGNFIFAGPGTLILTAANTYAGTTTISAGTLRIGNGSTTGSLGVGNITNNSVLDFHRSDDINISQVISGTGSLIQRGTASTTLTSANTFTGTTRMIAGSLNLAHTDALAGSTLDLATGDAGAISFTVPGNNTYLLGGLQGTRDLSNAGNLLSIGGNNNSTSYSGVISGLGGLTKSGSGVLTLSGNNTFTGATTVSAGSLILEGSASAQSGPILVNNGATLGGGGSVGANITLQSGATISPGSSPGTFTTSGDVTWSGGGNYNWQLQDATGTAGSANGWDLLNVGGVLDIQATTSSKFIINLWTLSSFSPDVNGAALNFNRTTVQSWKIATASGGIQNFSADKFTINTAATNGTSGFANSFTGGSFSVAVTGNDLLLVFTPGGQQYLNALAAAVETSQNYTTDNNLILNLALPADFLVAGGGGGAGGASASYNAGGGGGEVIVQSNVQITNATNAIVVGSGGPAGTTGASGGQSSAFGLSARGGSGAVTVSIGGASGSGNAGGSAASGPSGGVAGGGGGGQSAAGTNGVYNASPLVRLGGTGGAGLTSAISGTSLMYGFGGGGAAPNSNADSGPGPNGDGTKSTPRANSGGGGWSTSAGAMGVVVISYQGEQAAIGGTITNQNGVTVHTFNTSTGTFALGNNIKALLSGVISGSGNFTYNGPGSLTLSGVNTYTGSTSVTAGVLNVQNNTGTGTTAGGVTVSSGAALELQGGITVGAEALTINSTGVSNGGAFRNISGNNTWGGTVTLGSASRINSEVGTLTLSATNAITGANNLTIGGPGHTTVSGTITTNTGTLTKDGAGTLLLTGANTYTGLTTVSAGILQLNRTGGTTIPATNNVTVSGGTLKVSTDQALNNLTVSSGTLVVDAGVTLTINGTFTGGGTISNSGTIVVKGSSTFPGSSTTVSSMNNLTIDRSAGVTLNKDMTVTDALTLTAGVLDLGTNTLTVSGSITGASSSTYIKTSSTGGLKQSVSNTAVTFPVGNSAYNPVTLTNNTLTPDAFTVRVVDEVYANGTSSGSLVATNNRVKRTWDIEKASSSANTGNGVDLVFNWTPSATPAQINGTLVVPKLYHYESSAWVKKSIISNTTYDLTAGSLTFTGYKGDFSPFSIMDDGTALPVNWLSFTGRATHGEVELNWATASEQNNSHFEVERSVDAILFNKIGRVNAAVNPRIRNDFRYLDQQPLAGRSFYRLKQVDIDGKFSYSSIIQINGVALQGFKTWVLPGSNQLTLQVPQTITSASVMQVYDASGRLVSTKQVLPGLNQFDLGRHSGGVYHVRILQGGLLLYSTSVIK